ncbi:hypothetical protein [Agromyces humi]|jgi:hypothetical protein|uniref:hypothetical protein n=1 Tax=Agromyces humi TaxID=1766800 RepID=UPI001357432E|nr:hypothetical protein [Agromyces humi]
MSDARRPGEPLEGEYTDSELPLSAELPKEEYEEVEEVLDDDDDLGDTQEVDEVEIVEIVEIDDRDDDRLR